MTHSDVEIDTDNLKTEPKTLLLKLKVRFRVNTASSEGN